MAQVGEAGTMPGSSLPGARRCLTDAVLTESVLRWTDLINWTFVWSLPVGVRRNFHPRAQFFCAIARYGRGGGQG